MDAFQILVIILSVFLAIFLVLGIVFLVYLIQISHRIKHALQSVNDVVDSFRDFIGNLQQITSPVYLVRLALKFAKRYKRRRQNDQR